MIYLDYASNTPVDIRVLEAFYKTELEFLGNPNSSHQLGQLAFSKMQETIEKNASLLNVSPNEIIYTSGSSESNNLALKGLSYLSRHKGKHVITTCLEHSSVSATLTYLQEQGYEIEFVDILPDGTIDIEHLKDIMRNDTIIVSVCYVDSELGTVQPISKIGEILKQYPNCRFHVDGTQAVGKIQVNLESVDCFSFAPHKFYGLNGVGMLIKKEGLEIPQLIHGGKSTTIYRGGTPTLALAVSLYEALGISLENLEDRYIYVESLKNRLLEAFENYPLVRVNSSARAVPHILNISVKGVLGEDFQKALDKYGVCVSVKSACSVANNPSRAVLAVSKDKKNALNSFRISLSHLTTNEEIEEFIKIFDICYKELTE
ncbi:MAG: cysteine desulfurase [Defluviitaleaceae bacterium]|nr:cysteine desulfurase [Defluviitaleaceae bacterium]